MCEEKQIKDEMARVADEQNVNLMTMFMLAKDGKVGEVMALKQKAVDLNEQTFAQILAFGKLKQELIFLVSEKCSPEERVRRSAGCPKFEKHVARIFGEMQPRQLAAILIDDILARRPGP